MRSHFVQKSLQIPAPDPAQISPQQRRFEEIARDRGITKSSDLNPLTSREIMDQVNSEMGRGHQPSDRGGRWDFE